MVNRSNGRTYDFRNVKPAKRSRDKDIPRNREEIRDEDGLINWEAFWSQDFVEEDWLIEPLLPRGREIATFCAAGMGKSELALFVAVRAAIGQGVLHLAAGEPIEVIYLDYEMTDNDLRGRLIAMGFGPDDDLSHFHYYLLPTLPPLDRPEGGEAVLKLVEKHNAVLVIVDTTGRVLSGRENDSDSLRDFHQHTGMKLKAREVTVWRLDHAGKNEEAGQRGTSAKNDDVDVIWKYSRTRTGARLNCSRWKKRQSWVPDSINLARLIDPVRFEFPQSALPRGTRDTIRLLDSLNVPLDASVRAARAILAEHDQHIENALLTTAVRERKQPRNTKNKNSKIKENSAFA